MNLKKTPLAELATGTGAHISVEGIISRSPCASWSKI